MGIKLFRVKWLRMKRNGLETHGQRWYIQVCGFNINLKKYFRNRNKAEQPTLLCEHSEENSEITKDTGKEEGKQ